MMKIRRFNENLGNDINELHDRCIDYFADLTDSDTVVVELYEGQIYISFSNLEEEYKSFQNLLKKTSVYLEVLEDINAKISVLKEEYDYININFEFDGENYIFTLDFDIIIQKEFYTISDNNIVLDKDKLKKMLDLDSIPVSFDINSDGQNEIFRINFMNNNDFDQAIGEDALITGFQTRDQRMTKKLTDIELEDYQLFTSISNVKRGENGTSYSRYGQQTKQAWSISLVLANSERNSDGTLRENKFNYTIK